MVGIREWVSRELCTRLKTTNIHFVALWVQIAINYSVVCVPPPHRTHVCRLDCANANPRGVLVQTNSICKIDANGYCALANRLSYVSISWGEFACHFFIVILVSGLDTTMPHPHDATYASRKINQTRSRAFEFIAFSESFRTHRRILDAVVNVACNSWYIRCLRDFPRAKMLTRDCVEYKW